MTDQQQKRHWFRLRRDRDFVDILTTLCAVIGLLLVLVFYGLDKRAAIPQIEVQARYLHRIQPDIYPGVISNVLDHVEAVSHLHRLILKEVPTFDFRNHFSKLLQFRKFELEIRNIKNVPVSLTDLALIDVRTGESNQVSAKAEECVIQNTELNEWQANPIIVLGPNETKKLSVIAILSANGGQQLTSARFEIKDNLGRIYFSNDTNFKEVSDLIVKRNP